MKGFMINELLMVCVLIMCVAYTVCSTCSSISVIPNGDEIHKQFYQVFITEYQITILIIPIPFDIF